MHPDREQLRAEYRAALGRFLQAGGEEGLLEGYELGRKAIAAGLSALEMAAIHHEALYEFLILAPSPQEVLSTLHRGDSFFAEALSPFKMLESGYQDLVHRLDELVERFVEARTRQLLLSKRLTDNIVATVPSGLLVLDRRTMRLIAANRSFYETFRLGPDEVLGRPLADVLETVGLEQAARALILSGAHPHRLECRSSSPRTGELVLSLTLTPVRLDEREQEGRQEADPDGELLLVIDDITERKRAEEALRRSEERFRSVFAQSPIGIMVCDAEGRPIEVNPACLNMLGLQGPGAAEALGLPHLCPEAAASRDRIARREVVLPRGGETAYLDIQVTPLTIQGSPGAYLVQIQDVTAHRLSEQALLEREAELRETVEKLRRAVHRTVTAMSRALEARDPYTAGHQERVARLAVAIAREMGVPEDVVDAVRTAALVHDIGKLYIPGEIMSRPGKLSQPELDLIRTHARAGYEILQPIDFPWPVAEIVLQHHERLDGSGYPQGLAGDSVMLEARILAVADVVEAMLSHRPYRPARTIEETRRELEAGRGVLYDPEVTDACLRLLDRIPLATLFTDPP